MHPRTPKRVKAMISDGYNLMPHADGYPLIYMTHNGEVLCPECATTLYNDDDAARFPDVSDYVEAGDVYWEGPSMQCDGCGSWLESAYGDPDDECEDS